MSGHKSLDYDSKQDIRHRIGLFRIRSIAQCSALLEAIPHMSAFVTHHDELMSVWVLDHSKYRGKGGIHSLEDRHTLQLTDAELNGRGKFIIGTILRRPMMMPLMATALLLSTTEEASLVSSSGKEFCSDLPPSGGNFSCRCTEHRRRFPDHRRGHIPVISA